MNTKRYNYILVILTALSIGVNGSKICFPHKNFVFGVGTASYQIEGAWNVSGKGESIWDRYTHEHPERVFDHSNGDVATDSYHLYRSDVQLIKQLKTKFYRFSISWPRILPDGFSNNINQDGIRYYTALIDELLANDIHPVVTMYHWDLPQYLQDLGGWTNPIMADYFVDYAKVLLDHFGDKVSTWLTFNEPLSFCREGYGGTDAPGPRASGLEDYMCGHTVLRAHAMTYRMYKRDYNKQRGWMGITLDFSWLEEASNSTVDREAAETARLFMFGWFAHPLFSHKGDYPEIMRTMVDQKSKIQGFTRSRLPRFTRDEVSMIKGSYDFLGLNHYTTYMVSQGNGQTDKKPSFKNDMGVKISQKDEWPKSNSTWLKVVPWGLRKTLNWIKKNCNNPLIMITENGVSTEKGLNDIQRIKYIDGYLRALHAAITRDKCRVFGYFYWSLIDNFEWMRGYSERFGLFEVDYACKERTRSARLSAQYFARVADTGCLPTDWYHFS